MMFESLRDEGYWRYRGRCRNCDFVCEWVVRRSGTNDWRQFRTYVMTQIFPQFLTRCERCGEEAVFDLMAISPSNGDFT